jgi:hypothetical protein
MGRRGAPDSVVAIRRTDSHESLEHSRAVTTEAPELFSFWETA